MILEENRVNARCRPAARYKRVTFLLFRFISTPSAFRGLSRARDITDRRSGLRSRKVRFTINETFDAGRGQEDARG